MEKTVVKALKVMEEISRSPAPCSLTSIADAVGITKSNAHRLVATLCACGYVRQTPNARTYEPTLRQWELGGLIFARLDLPTIAAPILAELNRKTEESVHLSILEGVEVLYVSALESPHAIRAYIRVGDRAPAYCTGTGRAMLAFQDADTIAKAGSQMEKYTDKTVSSPSELGAALEKIRQDGYALTFGEWRSGVVGVSAPVRTEDGRVVAAVGVAGPPDRMRDDSLTPYVDAVTDAVAQLSASLGVRGFVSPQSDH